MSHDLWQRAAALSARAHRHQRRKDGSTPYASHPFRVAMTISLIFGFDDPEILAGALLHDTIEDCDLDYDDILEQFGRNAADFVAVMSKDMRLEEEIREVAYDQQLAEGPWQGRLIKLADVYDNLSDASGGTKDAMLVRAERILALTGGDDELSGARAALTALMGRLGVDA